MIAACHPNKISKGRGLCGACYDKVLKTENPAYALRQQRNTQAWKDKNPARYVEYGRRRRDKIANDPETKARRRNTLLKHKYGITQDDYDRMLEEQQGGCALCTRHPGRTPLHVDHSHQTGIVRGLLCHQCNWYLGTIEADATLLERIKVYLEKE